MSQVTKFNYDVTFQTKRWLFLPISQKWLDMKQQWLSEAVKMVKVKYGTYLIIITSEAFND